MTTPARHSDLNAMNTVFEIRTTHPAASGCSLVQGYGLTRTGAEALIDRFHKEDILPNIYWIVETASPAAPHLLPPTKNRPR